MRQDRNKKTIANLQGIIGLLIFTLTIYTSLGFKESNYRQTGNGKILYSRNCARCHGQEGNKGWLGAHNLKKSVLGDSAIIQKIRTGKGFMPSFKKKLTTDECIEVMVYIKTLRNN
ncbi:c-type cytochrome [Flavitalea flava]